MRAKPLPSFVAGVRRQRYKGAAAGLPAMWFPTKEAAIAARQVEKILTWRFADDAREKREFYVKWQFASYHQCSWIDEAQLLQARRCSCDARSTERPALCVTARYAHPGALPRARRRKHRRIASPPSISLHHRA